MNLGLPVPLDTLTTDAILFYIFAGLAVLSALVVIGQRNPIYSAFGLIVTLVSLSAIFGLLGSPFIAALQIVVYAGAIMVLFVFVIMLLNVKGEEHERTGILMPVAGGGLVLLLILQVGVVMMREAGGAKVGFDASTISVARLLFSTTNPQYLYVFEATSILILAALVGSIALAKKDL